MILLLFTATGPPPVINVIPRFSSAAVTVPARASATVEVPARPSATTALEVT